MDKQFGFRTGPLKTKTALQAAQMLAELGFDCLELCLESADVHPEQLGEIQCHRLRADLDRLGIAIASVSYHGDREPFELRRANQERTIWIARWLGTDIVVLNAEKCTDRERQWAQHVEHLAHLSQVAESADVLLAVEPEPLLVIGSSQEMFDMIKAVGSPCLNVNLDVGHAHITDPDLAATVRQLGSRIVHLHLDDIQDRVHRHLPLGQGDIDYTGLREALAEINYTGPYVADLFGSDQAPRQIAAQALVDMRRHFA